MRRVMLTCSAVSNYALLQRSASCRCKAQYSVLRVEGKPSGTQWSSKMDSLQKSPSVRVRILLLSLVWFLVALFFVLQYGGIGIIIGPRAMPWLFTLGLAFLPLQTSNDLLIWMFGGWLFYAGLMTWALKVRERIWFFIIFGGLCLILILNVYGCSTMNVGY